MILDRTKFQKVSFVKGKHSASLKVNDPHFTSLAKLGNDMYEIVQKQKRVKLDIPMQIGFFIMQYAKLRLLQFYYNFLDVYVDRADFECIEQDTDSQYIAISGDRIESLIKPEMQDQFKSILQDNCHDNYDANETNYLCRTCCTDHANFDFRTPGLFKVDCESARETLALQSKTYLLVDADKDGRKQDFVIKSKGLTQRAIKSPYKHYSNALQYGLASGVINQGFRPRNNTIYTYRQYRIGFTFNYFKREVLDQKILVNKDHPVFKQQPEFRPWESSGILTKPLDTIVCPWPLETRNRYIFQCFQTLGPLHNFYFQYGERRFKNLWHAYAFSLAKFHNKHDLARQIGQCTDMKAVHKLFKTIEISGEWFDICEQEMKSIAEMKFQSCPAVKYALSDIKSKNLTIFYADKYDKIFGTGHDHVITKMKKVKHMRGRNVLGNIWTEFLNRIV